MTIPAFWVPVLTGVFGPFILKFFANAYLSKPLPPEGEVLLMCVVWVISFSRCCSVWLRDPKLNCLLIFQ